jgi:hypothetical protein
MFKNPKIIHRIYFDDFFPFKDYFTNYEITWHTQMPEYTILKYNSSNVDTKINEWMRRAHAENSPVFMSEFIRWDALLKEGGLYLDADCEILDGAKLHNLIEDLYASDEYDAFIGVEQAQNGYPTAQTIAAKPGSALVKFMHNMYNQHLSSPLWHWREERGLIGPQLMSLYFRDNGLMLNKGFFCNLDAPMVFARVKIYTQDYFSPKFAIDGKKLFHTKNTCVYHLFSNLNVEFSEDTLINLRTEPKRYEEYRQFLANSKPRLIGKSLRRRNGKLHYGRLLRKMFLHPLTTLRRFIK